LYIWFLKLWSQVSPLTPEWYRLPSIVFAGLAVGTLYELGQRMFSAGVGHAAAAALLFSNLLQGLSHETRVYSLLVWLAVLAMLLLHTMLQHGGWWRAVLLGGVVAALFYAHFTAVFVYAVFGLLVVAQPPQARRWPLLLLAVSVALVLVLPYLNLFLHRVAFSTEQGTWVPVVTRFSTWWNTQARLCNSPAILILLLVLVTTSVATSWRKWPTRQRRRIVWLMVWGIGLGLGVWAISFQIPLFLNRYLAVLVPGTALLGAAVAFGRGASGWLQVLGFVWIVGLAVEFKPNATYGLSANSYHMAQVVQQHQQPSTVVVVQPSWACQHVALHRYPALLAEASHLFPNLRCYSVQCISIAAELDTTELLLAREVLLLEMGAHYTDPLQRVRTWLANHFPRADTLPEGVLLYRKP
jgi:4-amino-4-deoxy-L-arabinose transferase-like glycosyltransferase